MCGITGYIGTRQASAVLVDMLKKLEYRGYDSAGVALLDNSKLSVTKCKGRIKNLEDKLDKKDCSGSAGIGHTRWATHGRPSTANAHPHTDEKGRLALVHNGIIENADELKKELIAAGCSFVSETDTEVIVHLLSSYYEGDLVAALRRAIARLKGSYALAIISKDEPDRLVVARKDSPLAVCLGEGENFVASDVSAALDYTRRVIYLEDGDIAIVTAKTVDIYADGKKVERKADTVTFSPEAVQKKGFDHFMLKEIHEQPEVVGSIISRYVSGEGKIKFEGVDFSSSFLKGIEQIIILACGTAYHAGLIAKYAIEEFSRIPVWVDLGSEFRYRKPIIAKNTLAISISQSGETADTLAAVKEARKQGARVLSVCNVLGSSLTRESEAVIYIHAGPEISVASTKAYTAQVTVLFLIALYLAQTRKALPSKEIKEALDTLSKVPVLQREILKSADQIREIAEKHLNFGCFLYLGRNINFPSALEGALKLKEIAYIPAEGYAAGEMKHGPIALIDEYRAVVCLAPDSPVFDKMMSNIREILCRKGKVVTIATQGNELIKKHVEEVIFIPGIKESFSPLLTVLPMQLFAYYLAAAKGFDVDKPRNLAKSVTVE